MLQDSIRLRCESNEMQINALIYAMGEKADDILGSFRLSEEDGKTFKVEKVKSESFLVRKRKAIYERARFNIQ